MITMFTAKTQPMQIYRLQEYEFYDIHIVYTSGKIPGKPIDATQELQNATNQAIFEVG